MSNSTSRAVIPPPPPKTITVYRNGDAYFPGRKIVVNQRHVLSFDSFLTFLTHSVEAAFGAVRNVYTPREGHRVQDLDSLQHGEKYVAAGAERFKRLDYCHISTKKTPKRNKKEPILPVVHSRILVPARWKRITNESCTINVFSNGDVNASARIIIPKYTLTSWEHVLAMVTEKVHLRTGAVHRLYTLDGYVLRGSSELENNQYYVAVGADRFRVLPYKDWVPCKAAIWENNTVQGISEDSSPSVQRRRLGKDELGGFREDLERTAGGAGKSHADPVKPERDKQHGQVSRNPLLFTTGEASVFNAKNKRLEMVGAAEVQEDSQLKVDLPIDQVEAKVVEEEFDHGDSRASSPSRASPRGSDGSCQRRSVSPGSEKEVKRKGSGLAPTPRNGSVKSWAKEASGNEALSKLSRIRSRMSHFLKEQN